MCASVALTCGVPASVLSLPLNAGRTLAMASQNAVVSRLRFAALIRVSSEQQEKTGESLRTQRADLIKAVARLGAKIVAWYGGQEHATPGFEKKEVDRLLSDSARLPKTFDAVIVAHADRWSRDNIKSSQGLEVFEKHDIRFFVGEREHDLFNPDEKLYLALSAVIGQYHALSQAHRAVTNRINRAKRGEPTAGSLPFGRIWANKHWSIDPEKQKLIQRIAERYLAGEHLVTLAKEYGMNVASVYKILTNRCGTEWVIKFAAPRLKINESILFSIPRLLPEETIRAIKERLETNKTWRRGQQPVARYLLGRAVYCEHCGYALYGQLNHSKSRFYRHPHAYRVKPCPVKKCWIPADQLEELVIDDLFEMLGNPKATKRAVEAAIPNIKKVQESERRIVELEEALVRLKAGRTKVIRFVGDQLIADDDAQRQLAEMKRKEIRLNDQLRDLQAFLGNRPSSDSIKSAAAIVSKKFGKLRYMSDAKHRLVLKVGRVNDSSSDMTWDEKRALVEAAFMGKDAEGRRMGVYVRWHKPNKNGRRWSYDLRGHLFDPDTKQPYNRAQRAKAAINSAGTCLRRPKESPA